jgi:hypothetical protein
MLIPPRVWDALVDAGVAVTPIDSSTVELVGELFPGVPHAIRARVKYFSGPLSPEGVRRLRQAEPGEELLLVVPSATDAVRLAVEAAGWSLIAWNPESPHGPDGFLNAGEGRVLPISRGSGLEGRLPPRRRRGPAAFGAMTVVRHLLQVPGLTQVEVARRAGVSQGRVSQVFSDLTDRGLIRRLGRSGGHWHVERWDDLLDHWLGEYPGPHGIATYWYGTDGPVAQAERAVELLSRPVARDLPGEHRHGRVGRLRHWRPSVVSGDVAADRLAPWRRPERAVVYASEGRDLSAVGLVPSGSAEATCELVVPADPGVWTQAVPARSGFGLGEEPGQVGPELADRTQILWDVLRSPGPDSHQAAEKYRVFLRTAYRRAEQATRRGTDPSFDESLRRRGLSGGR